MRSIDLSANLSYKHTSPHCSDTDNRLPRRSTEIINSALVLPLSGGYEVSRSHYQINNLMRNHR
jgi:hypothetical protein